MSTGQIGADGPKQPRGPRLIRRFAVPIIFAWLGLIVLMAVAVPPLEKVAEERQVSLSPKDAPSVQAMEISGKKFKESDSDNFAMLVLESDGKLGAPLLRQHRQATARRPGPCAACAGLLG
jgi:RND superfamily putative drug exporter